MRCEYCGRFMTSNAPYDTPRGSNGEWFCTNEQCFNYEYMLYISPNCKPELVEKTCPKCGKTKSLKEFYKYDTGGNKYTYWCTDCIEHYIANTSVGAN